MKRNFTNWINNFKTSAWLRGLQEIRNAGIRCSRLPAGALAIMVRLRLFTASIGCPGPGVRQLLISLRLIQVIAADAASRHTFNRFLEALSRYR